MVQALTHPTVETLAPYAKRFAKTYLGVALVATIGWLILAAWVIPELLFDWFLGPLTVLSMAELAVTSTTVFATTVVIFAAGIAYERYR